MDRKNILKAGSVLLIIILILSSITGIGFTRQINNDENNSSTSISGIRIKTNRLGYCLEEKMAITIENIWEDEVEFYKFPKIEIFNEQGEKIFPSYIEEGNWLFNPGDRETYIWNQKDLEGNYVSPGNYTIRTSNSSEPIIATWITTIYDIGYVILVTGDACDNDPRPHEATKWIYDKLISLGYNDERIQYLDRLQYKLDPAVDDIACMETVRDTVKDWAETRVNWYNPLYIFMFGHGNGPPCCGTKYYFMVYNPAPDVDIIKPLDLRDWIDYLNFTVGGARVLVWLMSCHSGGFIPDLSRKGIITTTSTCPDLHTLAISEKPYELFTMYFLESIRHNYDWLAAFNLACFFSHLACAENIPLLDDNGDGIGHGVYDCTGEWEGLLVHDGDGIYADGIYMGVKTEGPIRIISVNPSRFIPPKKMGVTIPFWAQIENEVPLSNVSVCMMDPNWIVDNSTDLVPIPCKYFEMTDEDNDGNWTVDIPFEEFTVYPNATDFKFLIFVQGEDEETVAPLVTSVYFRNTTLDDEFPFVSIDKPLKRGIVGGSFNITGRASDDIKLGIIELYVDNILQETLIPPSSSHYYYDFSIDLTGVEKVSAIQVVVYDSSGNLCTQSIEVTVVTPPFKPDMPVGPVNGMTREEYTYSTRTIDPDDNQVYYLWDWDDGTASNWIGPFNSDELVSQTHVWDVEGIYLVRVKARDKYGTESLWSEPLKIIINRPDAPLVQLLYPRDGERLSEAVNVEWFAIDDNALNLPIYLFYTNNNGKSWISINDDPIYNNVDESHGEYEWDITGLTDGEYRLKIEAIGQSVVADNSDTFIIDNDYAGLKVSNIDITDTSTGSTMWVRDGDDIEITASIEHGTDIGRDDITADLSGFGKGSIVLPDSFNGYTAIWTLSKVVCSPSNGLITVRITADNVDTNSGSITADNMPPIAAIVKPIPNWVYFLNRPVLPFTSTFVIGGITIEAKSRDNYEVDKVCFYVDDELMESDDESPFSWYMNQKLRGNHELKIIAYDCTGNKQSHTMNMRILNLF
jgi:hypothetical protein